MNIVVDTLDDITQLFKTIFDEIHTKGLKAVCVLDEYIFLSSEEEKFLHFISQTLSRYIINKWEPVEIHKILAPFEFMKTEADEIAGYVQSDIELKQKRADILTEEIEEHIEKHSKIYVDGLYKFRLNRYKEELEFTVEMFVDEYSAKKSYDEFIALLKYFAQIQEPLIDAVVLEESDGVYKLYDLTGSPIKERFSEEFADELMPLNPKEEDLLISNLMAAMPGQIILKNVSMDKPVINTITQIFEGRIKNYENEKEKTPRRKNGKM